MDIDKYDRVLEACSLKKDLEIMPNGYQTIIGERGINLSGGQKQRVQIARAIYHDADIYMFDDPFSAVDAHTGSHLFKECLLGFLSSKTVVYVTHQVEFLPSADLILVIRDGRIVQAGKYNEIINSGTEFMELVGSHMDALAAHNMIKHTSNTSSDTIQGGPSASKSSVRVPQQAELKDTENGPSDEVRPRGQLVQEEERETGKVGFLIYWRYITMAYKGALVPLILFSQILFQVLEICSNYWMALESPLSDDLEPPVSGTMLISVYVALAVRSSACILIRTLLLVIAGYKTATMLFNKMHMCIFRAPMLFFDSTPTGRILNRASTDQDGVDTGIPLQIELFAFSIIHLLGIISVMSQVSVLQVFNSTSSTEVNKECLLGFLASKTVVYVTRQVEFLPSSDFILFMKDGRIAEAGKYSEILNSEAKFMQLVGPHMDDLVAHNMIERSCGTSSNSIKVDSSDSKLGPQITLKEGLDHEENEK
ncbi:probable non-intrinsic ABC protein 5 [Musa acuminata AAA Group]|uniref:probable non-intrinsic ABC protein 5 n=1 Tax=Musa acuminata AAA Group TaxID=214697 RepID=UPI0031D54B7C